MQGLVKKHKSGDSKTASNKKKGNFSNKTWSRKADEAKEASKKDLAAFVKKQVKNQVKELASFDKKRKSSESSDEEEDGELMAFNADLAEFNYEDMEKLSIDEDDVSV